MFYIDESKSIGFCAEASAEGQPFSTKADLGEITKEFSKKDLTDTWNLFAGSPGAFSDLKPQKMFKNRPYGLAAIWKAIQVLVPDGEAPAPTKTAKVARIKAESKVKAKRAGGKKESILALIGRKAGATAAELMQATGWQAHSLRGFMSTLASKHGVPVASEKSASGERVYRTA